MHSKAQCVSPLEEHPHCCPDSHSNTSFLGYTREDTLQRGPGDSQPAAHGCARSGRAPFPIKHSLKGCLRWWSRNCCPGDVSLSYLSQQVCVCLHPFNTCRCFIVITAPSRSGLYIFLSSEDSHFHPVPHADPFCTPNLATLCHCRKRTEGKLLWGGSRGSSASPAPPGLHRTAGRVALGCFSAVFHNKTLLIHLALPRYINLLPSLDLLP